MKYDEIDEMSWWHDKDLWILWSMMMNTEIIYKSNYKINYNMMMMMKIFLIYDQPLPGQG